MLPQYKRRDFKKIVHYCKQAEAFQDFPFSKPWTYSILDQQFPNSKFILTVRDSADVWYQSLLRHQTQVVGKGNIPTAKDLKEQMYIQKGHMYASKSAVVPVPDEDLYNEERLKQEYERYIDDVQAYFSHRPNDLLVLNLKDTDAYQRLCDFLGKKPKYAIMPWQNKTSD